MRTLPTFVLGTALALGAALALGTTDALAQRRRAPAPAPAPPSSAEPAAPNRGNSPYAARPGQEGGVRWNTPNASGNLGGPSTGGGGGGGP